MNNSLLLDDIFCNQIKELANQAFTLTELNHIQRWEFLKFKVREIGIKRSKEIKKEQRAKETNLIEELNNLLLKTNLRMTTLK